MKLVLAIALALSVGLNVWLLVRAPRLEVTAAPPEQVACAEKLQACERSAPSPRTLGALELRAVSSTLSPGLAAPVGVPPAPRKVISEPTPELERELLAQLVREKVQQEWLSQEQAILEGLRKSLPDAQKQRDDAAREGQKLAAELGLSQANTDTFVADYQTKRAVRIEAVRLALAADPPDWGVALEQVQGLYRDEDSLAYAWGGDEGRSRLRAAQAEGRTVILALGATLARRSWEDAVRW